jgi:hypothetical protein
MHSYIWMSPVPGLRRWQAQAKPISLRTQAGLVCAL